MVTDIDKRRRRQAEYIGRSRSARLYARLLMPVALVAFSVSLWSDPVLKPQLVAGVEEIKPILAGYLENTPLKDVLGPAEVTNPAEDLSNATEEASLSRNKHL